MMGTRTVQVDRRLLETLPYPDDHLPIVRMRNRLDDFQNGEMNPHWHAEFQFGLLLDGQLEYWAAKTPRQFCSYIVQPGDGFFVNSKVVHGCRQIVPGTEIFTFGMSPSFFASPLFGELYQQSIAPLLHSAAAFVLFPAQDKALTGLLSAFQEFQALRAGENGYELHSVQLICQIWREMLAQPCFGDALACLRDGNATLSGRLSRMIDFIRIHYAERLTVDDIARAGHVSRRECFRCFRATIDQTPTEFLTQHRLSVAAYQLLTTRIPLSILSEACGFESASYFSKRFKQRYGVPPHKFRA